MASKGPPSFDLPEPLLSALPSDPFDQLDVARKITSIALASRVSALESEADQLRSLLANKDSLLADLREQLDDLNASLADSDRQLALAHEEKETLVKENAALSNTVKKLNRDVSKLEVFKKTLMQSLQEEDENSQAGAPRVVPKSIAKATNFSTGSLLEEDSTPPPAKSSSVQTQFSETGSSILEDGGYSETTASRQNVPFSLPLKSQGGTPRLTPPDSPMISAGGSPTRLSKPASPRRHSISFSTTRPSMYSSLPTSHNTMTSPFDTGVQTGRARVDGKEFFRQVRSRLSYEQFSAFLANVKELNAHKQTREETLQKADDIFGPDNKDLYTIFEGLITRNIH